MRNLAYAAFFFSGLSSLIFQVIWSRMLTHVFGATGVAVSTVVSVFMAGLGLGAFLGGKYADRIKHPLMTYAATEIGVGLWAILVPFLVNPEGFLAEVNRWLRGSFGAESFGFMVARFLCVVPILLVPTTLMGTTLPLLARHFVRGGQKAGTVGAKVGVLYAINTAGAAAGPLLAGFVLLPLIGLSLTNAVAFSINFTLAILVYLLRKPLLEGTWQPGERIEILPRRVDKVRPPADIEVDAPATEDVRRGPDTDDALGATDDGTRFLGRFSRRAAVAAFALSGAASLCYQVVWTRALAMVIGSSVQSFTLILESFLVGIAAGSAIASGFLDRGRHTRVAVLVTSLLATALAATPWAMPQKATGVSLDTGLGAYLITLALASLPTLAAYWAARRNDAREAEGMVPDGTLAQLFMVAPTVVLALINVGLFRGVAPQLMSAAAILVATFIGVLVVMRRNVGLLLAAMQVFVGVSAFVVFLFQDEFSYAFAQLVSGVNDLPNHIGSVQALMFFTAALCTLPATLGMGAMFPLTVRVFSGGGEKVARDVGVVYTGNTLGSIVGAWLPGFILMPWLTMEVTVVRFGIITNFALGLLILVAVAADTERLTKGTADAAPVSKPPAWQTATIYVLSPLLPAAITLLWVQHMPQWKERTPLRWNQAHMTLGVFRLSSSAHLESPEDWSFANVVYYRDGLSTTVTVEQVGPHYALKNNGKVDASNGDDMPTQIMVAGFPLLMHPKAGTPLDVAIVGFGSGVTVGAALEFPVKQVDAIELEPGIVEASKFFSDVNHLNYPYDHFPYAARDRLHIVADDGRNYLASTDKTYDVVVSEPSNPWITGVSDLFTTDHFRITKRVLKPGGVYAQWVQLYELSPEHIKTIFRTFASQFKYVTVFSAEDLSSDTVLLGSDSPLPLDVSRIARGMRSPRVQEELERAYVHSPYDVLARILLSNKDEVLRYTEIEYRREGDTLKAFPQSSNHTACDAPACERRPAPLNTDDNALIEFAAPKDLIGFERYEGYLANVYATDWPYGKLADHVTGVGQGDEAARHFAELAMSLLAHGRKAEASELIKRSVETGTAEEAEAAAEVLALFLSDDHEPQVHIESPVPGPQMDRATALRLSAGFEAVKEAVRARAFASALAAMEQIPAPIRMHSGGAMRMLYGYLLYKAADGSYSRYQEAIEQLEELARTDHGYADAHPELHYFLSRAHDRNGSYDKALRNARIFVERMRRMKAEAASENVSPNVADPSDEPGNEDGTQPTTNGTAPESETLDAAGGAIQGRESPSG